MMLEWTGFFCTWKGFSNLHWTRSSAHSTAHMGTSPTQWFTHQHFNISENQMPEVHVSEVLNFYPLKLQNQAWSNFSPRTTTKKNTLWKCIENIFPVRLKLGSYLYTNPNNPRLNPLTQLRSFSQKVLRTRCYVYIASSCRNIMHHKIVQNGFDTILDLAKWSDRQDAHQSRMLSACSVKADFRWSVFVGSENTKKNGTMAASMNFLQHSATLNWQLDSSVSLSLSIYLCQLSEIFNFYLMFSFL